MSQGKWKAPYNAHVAWDRQQKYYDKRRALGKYRIVKRNEEKRDVKGKYELLNAIEEGAEDYEAEYEKKLALSFGDEGTRDAAEMEAAAKDLVRRKKKKSKKKAKDTEGPDVEAEPADKSKKKKLSKEAGDEKDIDRLDSSATEGKKEQGSYNGIRLKKRKAFNPLKTQEEEPADKKAKVGKDKKTGKKVEKVEKVPLKFAKAMRQFEEAKAAKEEEFRKRREEHKERNKKRKEFAKNRAIRYDALSTVTSRGQPNMKSRMDLMLSDIQNKLGSQSTSAGFSGAQLSLGQNFAGARQRKRF